jgi:hypothetical protein
MNRRGSGPSRLVLIVGAVLVLCLCVVFGGVQGLFGGLLGGGRTAGGGGGLLPGTGGQQAELGNLYTTTEVDRSGCPMDDVVEFYSNEPVYVSYDNSFIPRGTEMYAVLYQNGQVVEETQVLRSDRDQEICVWFVFEGRGGGLPPANYEVDIYLNDNLVDQIDFVVTQ